MLTETGFKGGLWSSVAKDHSGVLGLHNLTGLGRSPGSVSSGTGLAGSTPIYSQR